MAVTLNRNSEKVLAPNERNERNERKSFEKVRILAPGTQEKAILPNPEQFSAAKIPGWRRNGGGI